MRIQAKTWRKIEKEIKNRNRNISKISEKYKVSRRSLYKYAFRKGIMKQKEKNTRFKLKNKIKEWLGL